MLEGGPLVDLCGRGLGHKGRVGPDGSSNGLGAVRGKTRGQLPAQVGEQLAEASALRAQDGAVAQRGAQQQKQVLVGSRRGRDKLDYARISNYAKFCGGGAFVSA